MVAAGTTTLMAAADSGRSKTADNAIQNTQQLNSDSGRRTTAFNSRRRDSLTTPNKTAFIRETKASRLRAASIISPTDGSHASRRTAFIENAVTSHSSSNPSTGNSSTTQKNSVVTRSSSIPQILSRDREKHQQMSSKVPGVDKFMESNANENNASRRSRKVTKTPSQPSVFAQSQTTLSHCGNSSSLRPSAIPKLSAISRSTACQNSTDVLERVDALTALTKATMERVEKLASSSLVSSSQSSVTVPITRELKSKSTRLNPQKLPNYTDGKTVNQSAPVSILKNKTIDSCDVVQNEVNPLPSVAFKLDERIIKKHGILKKRSSLDENEILRRNCNSPDSILINNESITNEEFRSILKYERRSSLDELVKRSRNIDQHNPPSILKRKWLKFGCDDDKEETEPQGILKKNSQSLIDAVAKTFGVTWTELESVESTKEVRPILKKKLSHEESSSSDPPSLEPRPILKKKTSTESDELDDKPRKTILKYSSRKNSEESSNECETVPNSPSKLTVIKQNSLQRRTNSLPECDTNLVKPILKNPRSRSIHNESLSTDLVLRKRARSVGHDSTDFADNRINWEKKDRGSEDEQTVTFKFPDDDDNEDRNVKLDEKLGFDSDEAARRKLDHYSAKARRDKRFSRRNRDRTKIVNEVVTIANEALNKVEIADIRAIEEGHNHLEVPRDVRHEESYDRFCTQPVTHQEVQEATGLIKQERNLVNEDRSLSSMGNNGIDGSFKKDDPSDPSKLSLAERVKLFNRKIATESAAKASITIGQRRTNSRFRTQPVTSEEVEDAARNVPNALVTNSDDIQRHSSMKHPNVKKNEPGKSILKTTNSHTVSNASHRLSSMELDSCSNLSQDLSSNHVTKSYEISSEVKNYSGNTVPSYDNTDNKFIDNIIIEKNRTTDSNNSDNLSRDKNHCKSLEAVKNLRSMKAPTQSLNFPSISIAERLAALKRSGSTNWKRRVINESLPVSIIVDRSIITDKDMENRDICQKEKEELVITQKRLADRLEKLESAAEGWRKRVTMADAVKFSVAGKMRYDQIDKIEDISKPVFESMGNCAGIERKKKTPRKDDIKREMTISGDTRDPSDKKISVSISYNGVTESNNFEVSIQQVPRADDETFTSFYDRTTPEEHQEESIDITEDDFDLITTESELLGSRRSTQTQRRRVSTTHNPLKILAARTDLKSEYTEIKTGVAARMLKLNNIEKLERNSSLAVEALAGLASTENFSAISLKSIEDNSTGFLKLHPKDSDILLILIKGRRHVQVRLIEPSVASINSGDNYILVTRNEIYHYIGKYSNVIEKSRANEIAMNIFQTKDFGCKASKIVTINEELMINSSSDCDAFWKLLGHSDSSLPEIIDAGHPDEDELYETAMIDTNIVYEVVEGELVPLDKYWGAMPKIKMLEPSKILIFDFGTEMYIWNGKCAPPEVRKASLKLAGSLWNQGYDYSDCSISPISAASLIGKRSPKKCEVPMKKRERPSWCLLAKLTQHMETILFREKFLDWPNAYGIVKCKTIDKVIDKSDAKIILEPPDVKRMINYELPPVDLILEGCHLGRGTEWFDEEFSRQYLVTTTDVTVWHIDEYSYSRVNNSGQFFSGDSYIIRWMYLITVSGRELSGMPSKHAVEGRDRCAYFIWQGKNASINKQGTAALLTVELDKEQGPQIRVVEGSEPPAFLNLFRGGMIVYSGKQSDNYRANERGKIRSFFCRGTRKSEVSLLEVPYSLRQLRTRGSLIFVNHEIGITYVWYGKNSLPHVKSNTFHAAERLIERRPIEAGFDDNEEMRIVEIDEGREPESFLQGSMNRKLYGMMTKSISEHTPRLFHFSSISGEFKVSEVLCPQRDEQTVPFPFLQEELYQASQPTLFLFDNKDELWLWQGWWPDTGSEDQTGSGAIRWQAERRAAMTTALEYWKFNHNDNKKCQIFLVWAGLEPLEFINLFPTWCNRDDIAELNMKDGRAPGEMLSLENELTRLTQSTYPPAQLLQRPLPEGVDPTSLELYLSPQHFQELLGMNIEEFQNLPSWKQIDIKKKIGLF